MFSLQVETEYRKSVVNKRAYEFSIFFLLTGEEIFQLMARLIKQYVENFAAMVPRIVKAVGPPENKKQLLYLTSLMLNAGIHTQTLGMHPAWSRPQFSGLRNHVGLPTEDCSGYMGGCK
ncbi:hypothetical protein F2Q70_00003809 [Brassica cretica]|uniref:Uncharacterized protein n=1 Tax=Brassica cretica TaxID=69181 RepID=A0A8S9IXF8_BRACR|nr:hypothetical protein F2Q70_00003809 [Brassica cretica]